jgi:hypothetical protein
VDLAERRSLERDTTFDDWSIDGVPLRTCVSARWGVTEPPRELTRLWPEAPHAAVADLRALLGDGPPDFSDGRVALLVCPIDQDLNCGTLSARVVRGAGVVEWRDVGWQVDFEAFVPQPDEYGPLLDYRFDRTAYEELLRGLLVRYEASAASCPRLPLVAPRRRRWLRCRR